LDYATLLKAFNNMLNTVDELSTELVKLRVEHNEMLTVIDQIRESGNNTIATLEKLEADFNELSGWIDIPGSNEPNPY
jgi:uncharacterized coiled-coil DUF342 family protein